MPKDTFLHLPVSKQNEIIDQCLKEFEEHCLSESSVANIVHRLNMARGSFYQYFEDLESCYFYLLSKYTIEAHQIFIDLLEESKFDVGMALEQYGEKIADEIYNKKKHSLYKNRYLDWTLILQKKWVEYRAKENANTMSIKNFIPIDVAHNVKMQEAMHIVKASIHDLIQRSFIEDWTKKKFILKYKIQIDLLRTGLNNYIGR